MKKILLSIFCVFAAISLVSAQAFPDDGVGADTDPDGNVNVYCATSISGSSGDIVGGIPITVAGVVGVDLPEAACPPDGSVVVDAAMVPPVLGLTVTIASVDITFSDGSFAGDLDVALVGPAGQNIILMDGVGGGDNLGPNEVPPGVETYSWAPGGADQDDFDGLNPGPYDMVIPPPAEGLTCMAGQVAFPADDVNGAWSLTVTDNFGGDTHCISAVTVTFAPLDVDFDPTDCCECNLICPEETITEVIGGGECCATIFYDVALEGACEGAVLTLDDLDALGAITLDDGGMGGTAGVAGGVLTLTTPGPVGFFAPTTTSTASVALPVSCPEPGAVPPCGFSLPQLDDSFSFDYTASAGDGTPWIDWTVTLPDGSVPIDSDAGSPAAGSLPVTTIDCEATPTPTVEFLAGNTANGFGNVNFEISNFEYVVAPQLQPLNAAGEVDTTLLSGSCFPEGVTSVTWAAINPVDCSPALDGLGAPIECTFDIEVIAGYTPVSTLTCNDHVNISLDENCQVALGADDFLEGGPYMCYDDFMVNVWPFGVEANAITNVGGIPITYPKGEHTYEVCDPNNGNCCWGTFLIEDKLAPSFPVSNYSVTCFEDIPDDVLTVGASLSEGIILKEEDGTADVFAENTVGEYCFEVSSPCLTVTDINVSFAAILWGNSTFTITSPDGTVITLWDPGAFGTWSCPTFGTGIADLTFDDDAPQLPCSCADFQGGGTWDSEGFCGNANGSLGDFEGENLNGEWCIAFDVTDMFAGATEVFELSVYFNDGDTACDSDPNTVGTYLASADQCDCQSFDFVDTYSNADCENGQVIRTWTCTDACGNVSDPVVQTITITPLSFDGLGSDWFVPPPLIYLPCGTGTSPQDIADYFDNFVEIQEDSIDTDGDLILDDFVDVDWDGIYDFIGDGSLDVPGLPDIDDCPDSDLDCPAGIIEFQEGVTMGYPYYFAWGCNSSCNAKNSVHPQPIDNNICNLYVTYADQVIPACENGTSDCPGNEKVIRTWTVLDWCTASTIDYVQLIKSVDKTAPEITANDFGASVNPWGCEAAFQFPAPEHLHDDCSTVSNYWVSGPGTIGSVNGDGMAPYFATGVPKGEHQYIYETTDCCGNVGLDTITVTVVDDTPPTPIAKQDIVIGLTSGGYDTTGVAKLYAESIDNGSHDGDCGPVRFEIRRPAGANQCGNNGVNGYNNNVTYNNNGDESDNPNDTDGGAYVKFCCDDLTDVYTDPTTGNPVPFGEHQVILRVWDNGTDMIPGTMDDNYNETWANVRVEDKLWPTIVCPPDVTVCCGWDPEDLSKTGVGFANGTCTHYEVAVKNDSPLGGYDPVCNEGVIRRTWDIVLSREAGLDGVLNTADDAITWYDHECDQFITVEWESCWDPTWPGGPLEEFDPITGESLYEHKGCVDAAQPYCGDLIDWPNDDEIVCDDFEVEPPTWPAETCDLIGWNVKCDTFFFEEGDENNESGDPACFKVLKHWTLINWCIDSRYDNDPGPDGILGSDDDIEIGTYTHTQVLKFYDDVDPIVVAPDTCIAVGSGAGGSGSGTDGCESEVNLWGSATDGDSDCMSAWIKWQVFIDLWGDWTIDYEFSSYVSPFDQNFGTPINELYVPPTAPGDHVVNQGSTMGLTLPEIVEGSKYQHRAVWKASDGCGNVTSHTSYFTVEDKKAPTPFCLNVSTAVMQAPFGNVELWACDFEQGSFDNCTPYDRLRWSFGEDDLPEDSNPLYNADSRCTSKTFDCDDLMSSEDGIIEQDIYVWDECGNYDFCTIEIRLLDNNGACEETGGGNSRIAGNVATEFGSDVEDVQVTISSVLPDYPMSIMTDADGMFNDGTQHLNNADYAINAVKDVDYLNGVSTLDIVIIQRHILGLADLTSPYKMIAADVNDDQAITAFDLSELRKLILDVYSELPSNDSWRFADASQNLTINNAFNYDELLSIAQLSQDELAMDFVAMKIGDVNESVVLNATDDADTRNASLNLIVEDAAVTAGEEFTVEFTAANFEDIVGYQFTMNTNNVELLDVVSGAIEMNEANFAVLDANTVTVSWNSIEAISTDDVLFEMTFKATANTTVLDGVTISSAVTGAEAYNADYETMNVTLGTGEVSYTLLQNEPNPFNQTTAINYTVPSAAAATLTVYDVTGKVVTVVNDNATAGLNTITLQRAELGASGVLYYTLESGDFTATKKMILID